MIYTNIVGGLGNQIFQYAIARQLAVLNGTEVGLVIDNFQSFKLFPYLLDTLDITAQVVERPTIYKIPDLAGAHELTGRFSASVLAMRNKNMFLSGYWQCERYFKGVRNLLLRELWPKGHSLISGALSPNTCAIHIRRNDRVSNAMTQDIYGLCSIAYYGAALNKIKQVTGSYPETYAIFSDDLDWCRVNVPKFIPNKAQIIYASTDNPVFDLARMRTCKHFIIPNSSFSWWGAWLGTNPDKVIVAPAQWTNDPVRNSWDIIPDDEHWYKQEII